MQYFWGLDAAVEVYRNDELSIADMETKSPAGIYISRPCSPNEPGLLYRSFSISRDSSRFSVFALASRALAWCLMAMSCGPVMHGKTSRFTITALACLRIYRAFTTTLPQQQIPTLPDYLQVTAWTEDG